MSFHGASTVDYKVYKLDVSGDEGEWVVDHRKPVTTVTATTDSTGHVSIEELVRVLKNAGFHVATRGPDRVWFSGKTDGTLVVHMADDYPVLELKYLRHHKIVPVEPLLSLVDQERGDENPLRTESIVLIGLGVVAAGSLGYWLYMLSQSQTQPQTQPQAQPEQG